MLLTSKFTKFTLLVNIALITFSITSCSNSSPAIKTFTNKNLRPSQYATLEAPTGILILEIDGKELSYATQYHILPGKHKLHVMVSAFKGEQAYKVGNIDISFNATAEHLYHIKSLATSKQNNKSKKYLWIEDITLDTVVVGKKP